MAADVTYQSDVVIIGGGIAGIVTALELLDYKRKVIIIDRDKSEKFGGQAITSFGGMTLIGTPTQKLKGIKDSPELAFQDWIDTAAFDEDDNFAKDWAQMYCHRSYQDIYKFVRKAKIHFLPAIMWPERGYYKPGNSLPRYHVMWGCGYQLTANLIKMLKEHKNASNLQIQYEHQVTDLEMSGKKILGCRGVMKNGSHFTVKAQNVVIAMGGVGGNLKVVKENWPKNLNKPPESLLIGSHPFCDGTSYKLAGSAGGVVKNIQNILNYPEGIRHPFPEFKDQGLRVLAPRSALWMQYDGRRFGPEPLLPYFDTNLAAERVCMQKKQYSWHIMNWKIALKELTLSGAEHNEAFRDKKFITLILNVLFGNKNLINRMIKESEDFITANTVEELAANMNKLTGSKDIDVDGMKQDILRYDAQIDRGEKFFNDDQLRRLESVRHWGGDRMKMCNFQKILDPGAMPLIAIRYQMLTRKSMGGIQTDLHSRVVDYKGNPVEGLYAAGESAGFGGGGINGKRTLEGTFVSNCILTGRVAARSICGEQNP